MLRKNVQCKRKKLQNNTPGIETTYSLSNYFSESHCTSFDINLFVKDLEKLINLIYKCYRYASSNQFCNYSETFQYLPVSSSSKPLVIPPNSGPKTSGMIYCEIFLKKTSRRSQ